MFQWQIFEIGLDPDIADAISRLFVKVTFYLVRKVHCVPVYKFNISLNVRDIKTWQNCLVLKSLLVLLQLVRLLHDTFFLGLRQSSLELSHLFRFSLLNFVSDSVIWGHE